jgi:shikimate kinase
MDQRGRAAAPAAGTILNALANGTGVAFAIDREVRATVHLLEDGGSVIGEIEGHPEADTRLIERCVERTVEAVADGRFTGGEVSTDASIPLAAGLKSSSAAANATVLATLAALDAVDAIDPLAAARLGVEAARDTGVTVTGAFDDATASMLGGLTITDNDTDTLRSRDTVDWAVAVWVPPERFHSAAADVERCERVRPIADLVADLASAGRYGTAMTVNGLAFTAALERPTEPMLEALPQARGVSLSGTGPSYVAIGEEDAIDAVTEAWGERPGTAWQTTTQREGARIL